MIYWGLAFPLRLQKLEVKVEAAQKETVPAPQCVWISPSEAACPWVFVDGDCLRSGGGPSK